MKLFDRITLLKAGYTRKEIDQMIEDETREPEEQHEDPEPKEQHEDPEPKEQHEDPEEHQENPEPEDKTDYKALFEAERKSKEALQKQNRNRDRSNPNKKTDLDIVKDIVSSFF